MKMLAVILACIGTACGSSSPTAASATTAPSAPTIEAIVFSFTADLVSMTTVGATAQVTALGTLTNGTTRDVTATCTNWQSDTPSVLSVSSAGLLTAQSTSGSATITTTCQGIRASGLLTVNPPPSNPPGFPIPGGGSACPNPPYSITVDPGNGRRHCREPNGQFAPDVCCGI